MSFGNVYTDPTVADFKARFVRDWSYGGTPQTVMDADVTNALADAATNINPYLFQNQAEYSQAFLYLAAHHLVTSFQASRLGTSSSWDWLQTGRSVDSVSESFEIPDWIMKDKYLAYLTTTQYGAKYCSIVAPRMVGNVWSTQAITRCQ